MFILYILTIIFLLDAVEEPVYLGMHDDIWALGVIYYMLFYNLPFNASNIPRLMQRLVATKYQVQPLV